MPSIDHCETPEARGASEVTMDCKPLELSNLGNKKGRLSSSDTGQNSNGRYRARTCDPLIKSQLLYQLS